LGGTSTGVTWVSKERRKRKTGYQYKDEIKLLGAPGKGKKGKKGGLNYGTKKGAA